MTDSGVSTRVLLMASRELHCLADLLHRFHSKELFCDIPCVISNHDDLRTMVQWCDMQHAMGNQHQHKSTGQQHKDDSTRRPIAQHDKAIEQSYARTQ